MVLLATVGVMAQSTETYDFLEYGKKGGVITWGGAADKVNKQNMTYINYITYGSEIKYFNNRIALQGNLDMNKDSGLKNSGSGGRNISIYNLSPGDKITVFPSANKLQAFSTNIYAEDDETKTALTQWTDIVSEKPYVVIGNEGDKVRVDIHLVRYGSLGKIVIETQSSETVAAPKCEITAANNEQRTITIIPAAAGSAGGAMGKTYYTMDGTTPDNIVGTEYSEPFTISKNTRIKAISYLANGTPSKVTTFEAEAGTIVPLNSNIIKVVRLTGADYIKNAVVDNVYTNDGVIGDPQVSFAYTFNGESVTLPYTVTEDGTLEATATAEGYSTASKSVDLKASYAVSRFMDFANLDITEDNIATVLGESWVYYSDARWANWATGFVYPNARLASSYTFGNILNGVGSENVNLCVLIGYGVGKITSGNTTYTINNPTEDEIALYIVDESYNKNDAYKAVEYASAYVDDPKMSHTISATTVIAKVYVYKPVQELLTVTEGEDFTAVGGYNNATYTRTIAANAYGTICLPFAPDAASLENYTFFKMQSAGADAINFVEEKAPVANTPYIYCLKAGKETTAITGGATVVSATPNDVVADDWTMKGSFTNQAINATTGNYYGLSSGTIVKANKTLTVKPYRAYFTSATGESAVALRITRGDETTEISAAELDVQPATVIYDLAGRRVEKMEKGIYIVNGKKVIR